MTRVDTKSFTELGKYLLNGYFLWQYSRDPYLEPNQKSMVELFRKNSSQLLVAVFAKKTNKNVRLC